MLGDWSEMRRQFDQMQCRLATGKRSVSSRQLDIVADANHAMTLLNEVALEHPVTKENYWKAANSSATGTKQRYS
jgi:hypothetical protein